MVRSQLQVLHMSHPPSLSDIIAMAARGEVTLLDVRESAELQASGTAKGALHVPLALVPMKADPKGLDFLPALSGKPIAVFCAAGARAGQAAQVLNGLGHTAWNIGGFGQWASAGGPVVKL
jgi:rhodanese-related sulfurtransferase